MLRKRVEKLEAQVPLRPGRLLERLERQGLLSLSYVDKALLQEMHATTSRRKTWSPEHHAAIERYEESLAVLLREVSDDELRGLISEVERSLGRPLNEIFEATAWDTAERCIEGSQSSKRSPIFRPRRTNGGAYASERYS
jgi:hypothetical protein